MDECRKKAPQIADQCYFYQWSETMFSSVATKCDLAVIPIPLDNTFAMYKPENKLVLMWRLGIPTVVSATPSYSAAMSNAGLNLACTNDTEWREKIIELLESEALRRHVGQKGFLQASKFYCDKVLSSKWDNVLKSLNIKNALVNI
jgi:glycosyltransferase involved in cell wall biosynthesis